MIPVLAMPEAIAALRDALRGGLDPSADPVRARVEVAHGQLLLMPAEWGGYVGVKVATVADRGQPRIQGTYLLHDAKTLTPLAILDGVALTAVRTAAVSAVAADLLATPDASRLVVFGTGPQAASHIAALRVIRPVDGVVVIGRDPDRTQAFASSVAGRVGSAADVADADVVVCVTTARTPLFDGDLLRPHATVVAVGSHEPTVREVDEATVCGSTVVVEARSAALREAGDVIQPVAAGVFDPDTLIDLATLVRGSAVVDPGRPRLFKSVGMAWEDLVVAASSWERR